MSTPTMLDIDGRTLLSLAAWIGYECSENTTEAGRGPTDKLGTAMKTKHRSRSLQGVATRRWASCKWARLSLSGRVAHGDCPWTSPFVDGGNHEMRMQIHVIPPRSFFVICFHCRVRIYEFLFVRFRKVCLVGGKSSAVGRSSL